MVPVYIMLVVAVTQKTCRVVTCGPNSMNFGAGSVWGGRIAFSAEPITRVRLDRRRLLLYFNANHTWSSFSNFTFIRSREAIPPLHKLHLYAFTVQRSITVRIYLQTATIPASYRHTVLLVPAPCSLLALLGPSFNRVILANLRKHVVVVLSLLVLPCYTVSIPTYIQRCLGDRGWPVLLPAIRSSFPVTRIKVPRYILLSSQPFYFSRQDLPSSKSCHASSILGLGLPMTWDGCKKPVDIAKLSVCWSCSQENVSTRIVCGLYFTTHNMDVSYLCL